MGRWSNLHYPRLSQRQREYLLGAMLGDDAFQFHKGSVNARLRAQQSLAHKKYLLWKYQIMKNHTLMPPRVVRNPRYDRVHWGIRFHTRATPELTKLYRFCYPNGQKTVSREWLAQLTAFSLAVWYMDDGTYAPGREFCMLYTGAFPYRQQLLIRRYFKDRWAITGCVLQRNRQQWCFRFTRLGTQQFFQTIEPYIKAEVPSMLYKLGYPERRWTQPIHERMNWRVYAWQLSEERLLKQQYGCVRSKFIAERLNRSANAVQMRARKLGLKGWRADRVSDGSGSYTVSKN